MPADVNNERIRHHNSHEMPSFSDILRSLSRRSRSGLRRFERFTHRSAASLRLIASILTVTAFVASAACFAGFIIYMGFDLSQADTASLRRMLRAAQAVFILRVAYGLIFFFRPTCRQTTWVKWIVDCMILLTLLPWIYPHPEHPWLPWLERMLYSEAFLYSSLGAYALVTLCYGIIRAVGKRTNPSLLLSASFLIFIFIGSLLLMLPKSTYAGISYTDALFVSTSAVCITGLTPVDVYTNFTPMGVTILAALIQIGGLGVMTFTSFFAIFFSGNASIYSQMLLRDMIYSRSMSALVPTLFYILGFTLTVEAIGAVAIWLSVTGTLGMTLEEEMAFAAFHSLSSFCNAGFSTLPQGMSNPMLLAAGNNSIYWVTTAIVVAGSIGFPILVNLRDAVVCRISELRARMRHREHEPHNVHPFNMNTKIVITTFMALLIAGTAAFLWLEWDNTLAGMTLWQKITQAAFNSATPRSAGFSSVNPASFRDITLVAVIFLMWVGGAAQSTGGGVKVNTLAAILLNLRAIVTGRPYVTAFQRTISVNSVRRANAVIALSIISYLIFSLLLLGLEPQLSTRSLLFESCSALFTVGSSLGATPLLSDASKILLCAAMFLGRVGIISLLTGIAGRQKAAIQPRYPSDNIIIN